MTELQAVLAACILMHTSDSGVTIYRDGYKEYFFPGPALSRESETVLRILVQENLVTMDENGTVQLTDHGRECGRGGWMKYCDQLAKDRRKAKR